MTAMHIFGLVMFGGIALLCLVACAFDLYRHRDAIASALLMESDRDREARRLRRAAADASDRAELHKRRLERRR